MAVSIREQILQGLVSDIESLSSIKTVERIQPSDEAELLNYAATQLPLVAVIGGVPVPKPHKKGKGGVDVFVSELKVQIYVYFMERTNPDTVLSALLNDLWVKLYSNQTRGGLCMYTILEPQVEIAAFDPYVAFSMNVNLTYKHTTGGI